MTDLHRVLYCSRNSIPGTPAEVAEHIAQILAVSRRNNARDGVTGGLLYSSGCFAQVLEGPRECVESAFERIQCDDRHGDVTVVMVGPVAERAYSDWSMAFHGLSDGDDALAAIALERALAGRTAAAEDIEGLMHKMMFNGSEAFTTPEMA